MTDFFDGVRMGSFDTEYDDDTIEMVLSESAMHLLSQAAAQTESAGPVVSPAAKESAAEPGVQARLGAGVPGAPAVQGTGKEQVVAEGQGPAKVQPVAEAPAAAKVTGVAEADAIAKALPVAEVQGTAKAQPVAQASPAPKAQLVADAQATPKAQPATALATPRAQATTDSPAATAKQHLIAKDQDPVPPGYRPPMSTLRFALILSLVALGSALLTAGTYFLTTRASPPVKVVTIRVPADPAPAFAVASTPSPVATMAATTAPATAPPATAPPSPLPATAAPGAASAAVTALTPAPESAPPTDQPATVRFVNPFDKKEVFEFPPGTSQADARDAVADLLAERARDRRGLLVKAPLVKTPRRNGKTADSGAPVVASGNAPRS